MAETTTSDGKERVAFDLMKLIAHAETDVKPKDRAYFLKLMRECVKATAGQGGPTVSAGALKNVTDG